MDITLRVAVFGAVCVALPRTLTTAAILAALFPAPAASQSYPNRPVRLVTGSAPGGGGDLTARAIAQKLSASLGQQVIVDDRAGATGMIANRFVGSAPPDGYTVLLQPSSFICISPHLNSTEVWDPARSLTGITQVSAYGLVVVVHPSVPARSIRELIAIAKAKPGVLNYVSSGVGSNFHLGAEMFKLRAGVDMVHVPYRGSPSAVVDLIAGRGGVLVMRLNRDIAAAVGSAELRELWKNRGVSTVTSTPDELSAKVKRDYERYGDLLKRLGVQGG